MEIRRKMAENMAYMMRLFKEKSGKSIEVLAQEWDIAPSTLQDYLSGKGNPTLAMVEHLAGKLGIDPVVLIAGREGPGQYETALVMLDALPDIASLPEEKRREFAELFLAQARLLGEARKANPARQELLGV